MRYLHDIGFEGAWATSFYFGLSCLAILPIALWRWRRLREGGKNLLLIGLLSGTALALYTLSFLYTTVVNALLIFYLTPVWSTLTGRFMLGERVTLARLLALTLGLVGLWVILGRDGSLPLPENPGDWMALISGIIWAYAAVYLNRSRAQASEFLTVFLVGGFVVSLVVLSVRPEFAHPPSNIKLGRDAIFAFVVLVMVAMPINFLILWATSLLSPARVGLLMLLEVVCGIAVARIVTDEPYGWVESVGTVLILGAGIVDMLQPASKIKRTGENA